VIERNGWRLLFHDCLIEQLQRLNAAARRAQAQNPEGYESNANVKLFKALAHLMLEVVPLDPNGDEYRQGNTMGSAMGNTLRHWRRAKIGRRFRLFFRFDSTAKIIIYAWVNDETTLRSAGGKRDPYAVFQKMLLRGQPPDSWDELMQASKSELP
jgi:toxin YhaV